MDDKLLVAILVSKISFYNSDFYNTAIDISQKILYKLVRASKREGFAKGKIRLALEDLKVESFELVPQPAGSAAKRIPRDSCWSVKAKRGGGFDEEDESRFE